MNTFLFFHFVIFFTQFYCRPYFLRLTFEGELSEDSEKYDETERVSVYI
jgi:hypothetical protein